MADADKEQKKAALQAKKERFFEKRARLVGARFLIKARAAQFMPSAQIAEVPPGKPDKPDKPNK